MTTAQSLDPAALIAQLTGAAGANKPAGPSPEMASLAESLKALVTQNQALMKAQEEAAARFAAVREANKVLLRTDATPENVTAALRVVYEDAGYGKEQIEQEVARYNAGLATQTPNANPGRGRPIAGEAVDEVDPNVAELAKLREQIAVLQQATTQNRGTHLNTVFDVEINKLLELPAVQSMLTSSRSWNGEENAKKLQDSFLEDVRERAYASMKDRVAGGRQLTEADVRTAVSAASSRLTTLMGQHIGDPTKLGRIPESGPDSLAESLKNVPVDPPKVDTGDADQLEALSQWVGDNFQKMALNSANKATTKV